VNSGLRNAGEACDRFAATDQMQVVKAAVRLLIQGYAIRQFSTGLAIRLRLRPFHQFGLLKPNCPANAAIGNSAFSNHLINGSRRNAKKLRRFADRQKNGSWLCRFRSRCCTVFRYHSLFSFSGFMNKISI
jgi:hypothetical protein